MIQYTDIVKDERSQRPIEGAQVFVYKIPEQDGDEPELATLYAADGVTTVGNPVTTNNLGVYSFWNPAGELVGDVYVGARLRYRSRLFVGGGYSGSAWTAAAAAQAAAGSKPYANTGAGLAGTSEGQTFWVDNGDGTGTTFRHDPGPVATELGRFIKDQTVSGAATLFAGGVPTTAALASSSGGDMVGFVQPDAGATNRTVQDKAREVASVQDFGATGDGATDDTASVQAAFDSGAGAIFVPRGVYVVDAVEGTDIHLYGSGTIRKKAGTKGAMIGLTGANRIEGITIDYDWENADQSPPNYGNAAVEQVQGSLDLAGVKFIRSFDSAVYVVGASLNIDGACSFTSGKPHNNLTGGNERPTYYVFCIADASTVNQVINIGGAYFEGASLDPTELHLNPTGIFITASAVDGFRFKAINISNPTLLGCSTNAGNGNITGAIDLYNGADNIVISGATIRYFTYAGLKVQNSSYFSIVGNTITDGSTVPVASFTASTTDTSTTLTVTAVGSGTLSVGMSVSGEGVPQGVQIAALGTGTGGAGTYILTQAAAATASGVAMTGGAVQTFHANGIVTIEKARGSTAEQKFGVISGNIISGCTYSGITNSCDFVSISDNVINGVSLAGGIATGVNNDASYVVISGNQGTDVLGVQILTTGDHVRVTGNTMSSGTGQADTALRFSGDDILIEGNSFVSGTIATSTGIRTNGPASNVRIGNNFVNRFPYGVDIRTGGGAVDKIIKGPNQFANISIGEYNLGGAVTNATQVSTAAWV